MKAVKSSMRLKKFAIMETELTFFPFPDDADDIDPEEIMAQWVIDIDFDISPSSMSDAHHIQTKVRINTEDKPGYHIDVIGVGLFTFDLSQTDKERNEFLFFSGVSICIASIRAYIANITSYGILGKYTIPAIDMKELLRSKNEED